MFTLSMFHYILCISAADSWASSNKVWHLEISLTSAESDSDLNLCAFPAIWKSRAASGRILVLAARRPMDKCKPSTQPTQMQSQPSPTAVPRHVIITSQAATTSDETRAERECACWLPTGNDACPAPRLFPRPVLLLPDAQLLPSDNL